MHAESLNILPALWTATDWIMRHAVDLATLASIASVFEAHRAAASVVNIKNTLTNVDQGAHAGRDLVWVDSIFKIDVRD